MASILIIDDEPLIRSICQEILEQAGYDVLLACNGREGLQLFRRTPANLVITDVFMPERDGLEVIMTLHRESPTVPIIAFTGKGMGRDFFERCQVLRCTAHHSKTLYRKGFDPGCAATPARNFLTRCESHCDTVASLREGR